MKPIAFTAIAALLGACSTTAPAPAPNPASINGAGEYVVVQDGTTYTLQIVPCIVHCGFSLDQIHVGSTGASTAYGFSNADVTVVGGLAGGTYITGLSGTQTSGLATSGTLNLSGKYGVNENGVRRPGDINLTADLAAGTLIGSTFSATVNGTINGAAISGTFTHGGSTGTLNGGFYGPAAAPTVAATITGTNLAGILVVN